MKIRIVHQLLREDGVWTVFSDGTQKLIPYSIDEEGREYVDLDANKELGDNPEVAFGNTVTLNP